MYAGSLFPLFRNATRNWVDAIESSLSIDRKTFELIPARGPAIHCDLFQKNLENFLSKPYFP